MASQVSSSTAHLVSTAPTMSSAAVPPNGRPAANKATSTSTTTVGPNTSHTSHASHTSHTSQPAQAAHTVHASHASHVTRPVQSQAANPSYGVQPSGIPMTRIPRPFADWKLVDRYELRRSIGTGSYGQVCEAFDRKEKRVVAIKRIPRVFDDVLDCKRILREVALLQRLHHDFVVRVFDVYIPEVEKFDELYIVLQIADSDLRKLMTTAVYLTELHVKTLLYNLLVAMKYVHSAGVLHRDLKPANVLCCADCSVRVCDFGLARTVDKSSSEIENSQPQKQQGIVKMGEPVMSGARKQLTGHVQTRWYRAPELILVQQDYTEAIDMWSIGCIFGELMNMIKENCPGQKDRCPLFPGRSAYPLSPDQKQSRDFRFYTRGASDQLKVIFDVIGTPSKEDVEALDKEDARKYVRYFERCPPVDLAKKFPGSTAMAVDLLKRMLVFNPKKRITVDEALAHPLFSDTRNEAIETVAPQKATVPFDDWKEMKKDQLRYAFLKEAQHFHPEIRIPPALERVGYGS